MWFLCGLIWWPQFVLSLNFSLKKNKMLNPSISAVKVWNDVDQKFDLCAKRNELFSNLPPNLPLQVNCIRLIRPIRPPDRPFFERSWQVKQLPTRRNQKLLRNKNSFSQASSLLLCIQLQSGKQWAVPAF